MRTDVLLGVISNIHRVHLSSSSCLFFKFSDVSLGSDFVPFFKKVTCTGKLVWEQISFHCRCSLSFLNFRAISNNLSVGMCRFYRKSLEKWQTKWISAVEKNHFQKILPVSKSKIVWLEVQKWKDTFKSTSSQKKTQFQRHLC